MLIFKSNKVINSINRHLLTCANGSVLEHRKHTLSHTQSLQRLLCFEAATESVWRCDADFFACKTGFSHPWLACKSLVQAQTSLHCSAQCLLHTHYRKVLLYSCSPRMVCVRGTGPVAPGPASPSLSQASIPCGLQTSGHEYYIRSDTKC